MAVEMKHLRVVLASGYPIVRLGLRQLLEPTCNILVVGEAHDGAQMLHLVDQLAPDVLLLDPCLHGITGVEAVQRLGTSGSAARVLVLSHRADDECVFDLIDAGVLGYLLMDEEPEAILAAAYGVARGEGGWFSRRVTEKVARRAPRDDGGLSLLTPRELEVARLMTLGLDNRRIAEKLCLRERTVKYHVGNVYSKLGVSSRSEVVLWGVRHGLVEK